MLFKLQCPANKIVHKNCIKNFNKKHGLLRVHVVIYYHMNFEVQKDKCEKCNKY
jgi:hypothetical protein